MMKPPWPFPQALALSQRHLPLHQTKGHRSGRLLLLAALACLVLATPRESYAQPQSEPRAQAQQTSRTGMLQRASQTRLYRSTAAAGHATWQLAGRAWTYARGLGTLTADRLEIALPGPAAKVVRLGRQLNPAPVLPFIFNKLKSSRALMAYQLSACLTGRAVSLGLLAAGFDPLTAAFAPWVFGVPRDLAVMFWWEHHQQDPAQRSITKTAKKIGQDYLQFVKDRRQANRARLTQPAKQPAPSSSPEPVSRFSQDPYFPQGP